MSRERRKNEDFIKWLLMNQSEVYYCKFCSRRSPAKRAVIALLNLYSFLVIYIFSKFGDV